MKINKISNTVGFRPDDPERHIKTVDGDLVNLFLLSQGRVRFGDGGDNTNGENIAGQFQQFTSDASANTEFNVAHTVGSIPVGAIVLWQDKAGDLYQGPTTGTNWTVTQVSFKSSGSSVEYKVFLVK